MSDLTKDLKFDLQLFAEGDGDDDGGNNAPTWMPVLPDEYKNDEYGKGFKTIGEFYKASKGMRAKLDSLPQPPGKAGEYEFPAPAEDSGITVDPKTEAWFRKTAFGLKVPKEMAGKLYAEFNAMVSAQVKAQGEKSVVDATKADELVHGEWGEDYDKNMKFVDKGIEDLGGEDLKKLLEDTGLGKNLVMLEALKQIGFEHSDSTMKEGVVSGGTNKWTLDDEYKSMKDLPPDRQ